MVSVIVNNGQYIIVNDGFAIKSNKFVVKLMVNNHSQ